MGLRRPKFVKTFDELISGYYGRESQRSVTAEDVIANYYGLSRTIRSADGEAARPAAVTMSRDDGEILDQLRGSSSFAAPGAVSEAGFEEYVVCIGTAPVTQPAAPPPPPEPPVAQAPQAPALAAPPAPAPAAPPTTDAAVAKEAMLDVRNPLEPAASTQPATDVAEHELAADMEAILSGAKVYDPASGRTVERDQLGAPKPPASPPPPPPAEVNSEQAIFDKLRESMTYANAYELGPMELENRFADFDSKADEDQRAAEERRQPTPTREADAKVGDADFLKDLDAIHERAEGAADAAARHAAESMPTTYTSSLATWNDDTGRDATCSPSALRLALAEPDAAYARPMYDTGEHALAGADLYEGQLVVGQSPGVAFSYGELLGMGDLYESVDQMMNTSAAELTRVKALIDRSTEYYKTNKSTGSLDVTNKEWDDATGGRYLELAEENYEHFSPNMFFNDAISKSATHHGNNQSTWEAYHRRAIEEAQKMAIAPENANRSYIPVWPLIINAFGDHFLTDAFASGHLINKELMIEYFRANFLSGGSLNSAGKGFFERVAKAAFVGDVKRKFSVLETADYPVCAFGWCFKWHPNIDTTSAFTKLLTAAAEEQPEKVANFAVKALHDRLNRNGVEVSNDAGDGTWKLTGDGYLNPKSLQVMQKAVRQSVDNINDPAILASNLDFGPLLDRVWRHVPKPTAAARTALVGLVREYTNPASTVLSNAAAEIIKDQVDALIKVLIKERKLQPA
jgi:hypothetical protein